MCFVGEGVRHSVEVVSRTGSQGTRESLTRFGQEGKYELITSWGTTNTTSRVYISILLILIVQFSSCMRWVIRWGDMEKAGSGEGAGLVTKYLGE